MCVYMCKREREGRKDIEEKGEEEGEGERKIDLRIGISQPRKCRPREWKKIA